MSSIAENKDVLLCHPLASDGWKTCTYFFRASPSRPSKDHLKRSTNAWTSCASVSLRDGVALFSRSEALSLTFRWALAEQSHPIARTALMFWTLSFDALLKQGAPHTSV